MELQVEELSLRNVSSLPLNVVLELKPPFSLLFGAEDGKIDSDKVTKVTGASITLDVKETYDLKIEFYPAFKDDCHIRTIDDVLSISYKEHPHIVS